MKHTFTNEAIEQFLKAKKVKGNLTQSVTDPKAIARELIESVPFRLPDQGHLFGERPHGALLADKYGFVLENFRLPYPKVVLEHTSSAQGRTPSNDAFDEKYEAMLIQLTEQDDGWIKGRVIFRTPKIKKWDICNYGFELRSDLSTGGLETRQVFETKGAGEFLQRYPDAFLNDVGGEITTVIEFLAILHCTNVQIDTHAPRKETAKRRASQGKKPLLTYKTLSIPGASGKSGAADGTHAEPRTHLRRGHIRRLGDGRRIWVNACVVNRTGRNGSVVKDYMVAP